VYAVDVRAARALSIPNVDDPEFLRKVGAQSKEELCAKLIAHLEVRRQAELKNRVMSAVLTELQGRMGTVRIPDKVVDAELEQRWTVLEGEFLRKKGVPVGDQTLACQQYTKNPVVRENTIFGLRISIALAAVARECGITLTRERFHA